MEQGYFCKKRCIKLDVDFEICNDCFRRKLSGFEDQDMCKEFNINYIDNEGKK